MPVEIREIIIRTEISSGDKALSVKAKERELAILKNQILEECKRMILMNTRKANNKR